MITKKIKTAIILTLYSFYFIKINCLADENKNLLKTIPACSTANEMKLIDLFRYDKNQKGGDGGEILEWSEVMGAVVLYPGEMGTVGSLNFGGGCGGRGANIERNLKDNAVLLLKPTETGLKICIPGFSGGLSWEFLDELSARYSNKSIAKPTK